MNRLHYVYLDATAAILGTITRIEDDDGGKTFRASSGFPSPRPLFGLDLLAARPTVLVLVVEGEKKAEKARTIFRDFVVVTTPFGAKSVGKADLTPLVTRDVIIWPDNDIAGFKYAADLAAALPQARIVDTSSFPAGWDLGDPLPEGATAIDLRKLVIDAKAPDATSSTAAANSKPKSKKKPNLKDNLKKSLEETKAERDGLLRKLKGLLSKTVENGCPEPEAAAAEALARELAQRLLD